MGNIIGDTIGYPYENALVAQVRKGGRITHDVNHEELRLRRYKMTAFEVQRLLESLPAANLATRGIDLDTNSLDSAGAAALSKFLQQNDAIRKLGLPRTGLDLFSIRALAPGLAATKSLTMLNIDDNLLDLSSWKALVSALKSNFTINTLYSSEPGSKSSPGGTLEPLFEFLKDNQRLTSVHLNSRINIDCKGLSQVLLHNSTLKRLEIGNCNIPPQDMKMLCDALLTNQTLESLDLSNNDIGFEGLIALADLLRVNSSLKFVDISHNRMAVSSSQMVQMRLTAKPSLLGLSSLVKCSTSIDPDRSNQALTDSTALIPPRKNTDPKPPQTSPTAADLEAEDAYLCYPHFSGNLLVTCELICQKYHHMVALDVQHNKISTLAHIVKLPFLHSLDVSFNEITEIPSLSGKMWQRMRVLQINNNVLTTVNELTNLPNLETLQIKANQITAIPNAFARMKLTSLVASGNPLGPPFDMFAKQDDDTAILTYLKEMKENGGDDWSTVKVVLCGKEGVGKTHLTRRLQKTTYPLNKSTDGIEIGLLPKMSGKSRDIQFKVFDFGGQEVFYPTHNFFLTGRALFLVVFSLVDMDNGRIEYWLRTLRSLSEIPPLVILVGTHLDGVKPTDVPDLKQRLQKYSKITRIHASCFVSNVTYNTFSLFTGAKSGMADLREKMLELAEMSSIIQQKVPPYYTEMMKLLSSRQSLGLPVVTWTQFKALCPQKRVDEPALRLMAKFLNDVGTITWFDRSVLRELVILDPKWLAEIMATLLVWKHIDRELYPKIITLLEQFDVLFPLHDRKDTWVIPCMLPTTPSVAFGEESKQFTRPMTSNQRTTYHKLQRRIKFGFAPKGFISRLIAAALHIRDVTPQSLWFNGVVIRRNSRPQRLDGPKPTAEAPELALLDYDDSTHTLTITSLIPIHRSDPCRDLFAQLVFSVMNIIDVQFNANKSNVATECACFHCLNSAQSGAPAFIDADLVAQAFMQGKSTLACPNDANAQFTIASVAPDICLSHLQVLGEEEIKIEKELARGGFGVVFLAWMGKTPVVVKELLIKDQVDEAEKKDKFTEWHTEVFIMSGLDHSNLVKLHGIMLSPLRLVMEYCNSSDLHDLLTSQGDQLTWEAKANLLLDVAKAGDYLHKRKPPIIHRDMRSPNVFLNKYLDGQGVAKYTAKLGDYGLARQAATTLKDSLATWQWLAPEVFGAGNYDISSDVYSFAMLLWCCAHPKQMPFASNHEYISKDDIRITKEQVLTNPDILDKYRANGREVLSQPDGDWIARSEEFKEIPIKRAIREQHLRPKFEYPNTMPGVLEELMRSCWHHEPNKRPTFEAVIKALEAFLESLKPKPTTPAVVRARLPVATKFEEKKSTNSASSKERTPWTTRKSNGRVGGPFQTPQLLTDVLECCDPKHKCFPLLVAVVSALVLAFLGIIFILYLIVRLFI